MADSAFYKQETLPGFSLDESPSEQIPKAIGPYKVESLLNKGGMSLLYLGVDPRTKTPLAIKILSPKFVTHPEAAELFLKEAQIINLASHPNIIKLYGEGKWEGGLYIAMELIQGISLKQFITQHSLSLKRSLEIVLQVAYALCHLHAHGIIHRDLKPENILINEEGEIKVIDFGIAQLHKEDKKKKEDSVMGTPHYMSPEQKKTHPKACFASDIYALGIIAYELVLGKLSFGIVHPHLLPKSLRKIIEKALAPSLADRYQDIVDFITDISSYLSSREMEEERPGADRFQELIENLHQAELCLSPKSLPSVGLIEMGITRHKTISHPGFYYDLFKLPNNALLFFTAKAVEDTIEASFSISNLRGAVRLLIAERQKATTPFFLASFLTDLSSSISSDFWKQSFGATLLLLSPKSDQLSFASFSYGSLFHLPQGSRSPRELIADNPFLSADQQFDFAITTDNWQIGDNLLLFSHIEPPSAQQKEKASAILSRSATQSAQREAEELDSFLLEQHPHLTSSLVLSIRRIG